MQTVVIFPVEAVQENRYYTNQTQQDGEASSDHLLQKKIKIKMKLCN